MSRLARCLLAACVATLAAQAAHADTLGTISAAHQKMALAHARMQTTITAEDGKVMHHSMEMDTIERLHITTDNVEFIALPEGTWIKRGGQWSKPPVDMSGMVKRFMPMAEETLHSAKNVSDDGTTTWNGQPVHAYSMDTDTTVMGMHATAHTKFYLNTAGLIVGSESDGVAMGHKSHTVQNISYDDAVRVHAPN